MDPQVVTIPHGEVLARAGSKADHAYLIAAGKCRLTRLMGEVVVPVSLLGPGDIVAAETLFSQEPGAVTATVEEELRAFALNPEDLKDGLDDLPPWIQSCLREQMHTQRLMDRPERSNVATIYGVCNILYAFLRLVDDGKGASLRGPLREIREELRKSRPASRSLVDPILEGLSQVGLIDLRRGDPLSPLILLPDVQLYRGFLIFLQNAADLKVGLHEHVFMMSSLDLSREAAILLDGMMLQEDLTERMFEPERAMVHLSLDRLQDIYAASGGNGGKLDAYHPCLKELEKLSAFTRVTDNERVSVFLNLRNLLRLNIRRDPVTNFIDVIDYLLELMFDSRHLTSPVREYTEEV